MGATGGRTEYSARARWNALVDGDDMDRFMVVTENDAPMSLEAETRPLVTRSQLAAHSKAVQAESDAKARSANKSAAGAGGGVAVDGRTPASSSRAEAGKSAEVTAVSPLVAAVVEAKAGQVDGHDADVAGKHLVDEVPEEMRILFTPPGQGGAEPFIVARLAWYAQARMLEVTPGFGVAREVLVGNERYVVEVTNASASAMGADEVIEQYKAAQAEAADDETRHNAAVGRFFEPSPPASHVLYVVTGEIVSGAEFTGEALYVQYAFEVDDSCWSARPLQAGSGRGGKPVLEGVTQLAQVRRVSAAAAGLPDGRSTQATIPTAMFGLPLEAQFEWRPPAARLGPDGEPLSPDDHTEVPAMPRLLLKVASYDWWERNRLEGYAHVDLPARPGHYMLEVPTWKPALSVRQQLQSYFIGGSPELAEFGHAAVPSSHEAGTPLNKLGFETESSGSLKIRLNVVRRSASVPGYTEWAAPNYGREAQKPGAAISPLARIGAFSSRPASSHYASLLNSKTWKEMKREREAAKKILYAYGLATLLLLLLVLLATASSAQWSPSPSTNTPLAPSSVALEQVGPVTVPALGGSFWTTFFELDDALARYVLRVQRVDKDGMRMNGKTGTLLAAEDQGPALWGYDTKSEAGGAVVVAFNDRRHRGDQDDAVRPSNGVDDAGDDSSARVEAHKYENVVLTRLEANGTTPWGRYGLLLSDNDDFEPQPRVVQRADGADEWMVVWPHFQRNGHEHTCIRAQRISAGGAMGWPFGGVCVYANSPEEPGMLSVVAGMANDGQPMFVVAWMKDTRRHKDHWLQMAAYDWKSGKPLWGDAPITIYSASQMASGVYPQLRIGPASEVVLAWFVTTPHNTFEAFWQMVDASGKVLFTPGGVPVADSSALSYLVPIPAYDSERGVVYVVYMAATHAQDERGIYVSAFNVTDGGKPLSSGPWSPAGWPIVPLAPTTQVNADQPLLTTYPSGSTLLLGYSTGHPYNTLRLLRIGDAHSDATIVWNATVSDASSSKYAVTIATPLGEIGEVPIVMTWDDNRGAQWDVFGQGVTADGQLGPPQ
ncbi:uncharacterized protein AMSG_10339 [Thecamonas trahens ATCC 50062]|uniref:Uncharacterized protein n=1 Tax=Thecamonas trahens ATCC 50062 TaxID=461836 RepID=A0A0L0DQP3_THETB|nr:hypothetical protein AMSG_10339 [Thecamonas trahens ATCC 50062]KNC54346.1 hypothetical protein AMSG_10339 [Thecamonas trahens ATCC 50062]|eukprot:XP_013753802.1 hypothetical protein AMSG_10339 [Thecamonas trahens ATCC 50062]